MKGLNLSRFKKVGCDDRSTTLEDDKGHRVIIAHHALSPALKKQLKDLEEVKGYAKGGGVSKEEGDFLKDPPIASELAGPAPANTGGASGTWE